MDTKIMRYLWRTSTKRVRKRNEQLPKRPITIERPADKDRADECAKYVEPQVSGKIVGG